MTVRVKNLMTALVRMLVDKLAPSLFKTDWAWFALHIVHEIFPDDYGEGEWDAFLEKGAGGDDR